MADECPDLSTRRGVPQSCDVVPRRGDDALAVGIERGAPYFITNEHADPLASLNVPYPRGFVVRRGDDALAVGIEGGVPDIMLVADEHTDLRPVSASHTRAVESHDAVTMRFPSALNARLPLTSMAREDGSVGRSRRPHQCGLVFRRGDDAPSVGAERGAP